MRARCANKGEKVGVMQVAKSFVRVCARNYSGTQFIAPRQGPIPVPGLVTTDLQTSPDQKLDINWEAKSNRHIL